jgi:hypothetical protein
VKRWLKSRRWYILAAAFIVLSLGAVWFVSDGKVEEGSPMAVEFPNGSSLNFGTPSLLMNLNQRTWMAWINLVSAQTSGYPHTIMVEEDTSLWTARTEFDIYVYGAENKIRYRHWWSSNAGTWDAASLSFTYNVWYHVAVTYDRTSVANDAVLYVNGVPKTVTEITTPAGTVVNESALVYYTGGIATYSPYSLIRISDQRIYNRILSADEIAWIYASRCMRDNLNGLLFAPVLYGAAGLAHPDGATLAAGNIIRDPMSGAEGVPAGSPILRAETVLSICP